jgi:hypothetical protein
MLAGAQLNANAIAGLCGFAVASAACLGVAWRRAGSGVLWWRLGALHGLCALEILLNLRYRGHDLVVPMLERRGWYGARQGWQGAAVVVALVVAAALTWLAARRQRGDGAAIGAVVGTSLAFSLFAVETISLHRIDAVMYVEAGPLLALAWMWLAASAIVTLSALAALAAQTAKAAGTRAASPPDSG